MYSAAEAGQYGYDGESGLGSSFGSKAVRLGLN